LGVLTYQPKEIIAYRGVKTRNLRRCILPEFLSFIFSEFLGFLGIDFWDLSLCCRRAENASNLPQVALFSFWSINIPG
jgi:hypothetical protein